MQEHNSSHSVQLNYGTLGRRIVEGKGVLCIQEAFKKLNEK